MISAISAAATARSTGADAPATDVMRIVPLPPSPRPNTMSASSTLVSRGSSASRPQNAVSGKPSEASAPVNCRATRVKASVPFHSGA